MLRQLPTSSALSTEESISDAESDAARGRGRMALMAVCQRPTFQSQTKQDELHQRGVER